MKYKIGIVSLGCDKNLIDAETMLHTLSKDGFEITNNHEEADILIVNTCGFIESAKQESIDTILDLADYKSQGNCKLLIATGCLAQRYKEKITAEMPEVDAVVGTGSYSEIADVIKEGLKGQKVHRFGDINKPFDEFERVQTTPSYTAYIKIAEGCDNFCTYCIIPALRGKYRSRTIESIYNEALQLAKNDVKEIILIAQDTTMYGIDLYNKKMLPELLNKLCTIDGIRWIRLMYCYPEGIDKELIDTIKNQEKVCKYLDIPMQHSNDEILKRMGRRTSRKKLSGLVDTLRREIPQVAIRTSLIVGFPGETNEQFEDLLDFLKENKLDRVGAFTYSKEEDTPAAKFKDQVPKSVKEKRLGSIMALQQDISRDKNSQLTGNIQKVLVEGNYDGDIYIGRTYKDAPEIDGQVYFSSKKRIEPGSFVDVYIAQADEYDLMGEIVDESGK